MPSTSPSRPRMNRAERRDQLLDIAAGLFTERGYDATSMDELARRAGISKPIVYDHFGSKDGVFTACLERSTKALTVHIERAVIGADGPKGRLYAGSLAFFRFISSKPSWRSVLDTSGRSRIEVEEHAARVRQRQSDFTAAVIAVGAREAGVLLDPGRTDAIAHTMIGAYEALALWWRTHPDHTAEEITTWYVELMWPGLEAALGWPDG